MNGVVLEKRLTNRGTFEKNNIPNVRLCGKPGSDERASDFIANTFGFTKSDAYRLLELYSDRKHVLKIAYAAAELSREQKKGFVSSLSKENCAVVYLDISQNANSILKYVPKSNGNERNGNGYPGNLQSLTYCGSFCNPQAPFNPKKYFFHSQVQRALDKR